MKPRIGIPLSLDDRGRWKSGRDYHYINAHYAEALGRAGARVVYVPPQDNPAALLEGLDGLLIPGGDDFVPAAGYADVKFEPTPKRQLVFDRALALAALEVELPTLGICYGMQLLSLVRGGTLHFDLETDLAEADEHRLDATDGRHAIEITAGSRLAELLGAESLVVNSQHHQALADPGPEFTVTARAPDGVIEAIEHRQQRFCIGVQWHPERLDEPSGARLFAGFVEACRG